MISEVYNCDCLEYMRSLPDKHFDLCIADPPYGLDKKSTHGRGKLKNRALNRGGIQRWDIKPPQEIFDEIFRISRNQVIWGGNYFPLPPTRCFVCWDKQQVWPNFSQCELAWTSFNKPAKHITIPNRGGLIDKITWHPTSKPIELYAYILDVFAKQGDFNAKFFWRNEAYILTIVHLDIILSALVLTTNFLMTGNPFEIWNG